MTFWIHSIKWSYFATKTFRFLQPVMQPVRYGTSECAHHPLKFEIYLYTRKFQGKVRWRGGVIAILNLSKVHIYNSSLRFVVSSHCRSHSNPVSPSIWSQGFAAYNHSAWVSSMTFSCRLFCQQALLWHIIGTRLFSSLILQLLSFCSAPCVIR